MFGPTALCLLARWDVEFGILNDSPDVDRAFDFGLVPPPAPNP